MNTFRRHCGLLVAALVVSFSPANAEVMADGPGRFTVDIPQPTSRDVKFADTAAGKVKIFILIHDGGTLAHMVGYNDYPAGALTGKDPAIAYEGWAKGQAGGMNGVIRSIVNHQLGEIVGREMIVDIKSQNTVARSRCFIEGDRLYQVMYLGPTGSENSASAVQFLDSFRLQR